MIYAVEFLLWYFTAVAVILVSLLLIYVKSSFSYWKKRDVPYIEPSFPFGNFDNPLASAKSQAHYYKDFYTKFKAMGKKYAGVYLFNSPVFVPIDPLYNKHILVKNFDNFRDRGFYNNEKHQPIAANLFTKDGDKWRLLRMKFTPTFTSAKMKIMFNLMVKATKSLEKHVEQHVISKTPVSPRDCVSRFTSDIIGTCAFGVECNSFEDTTFASLLRNIFEGTTGVIKTTFCIALPKLSEFLRIPLMPWKETTIICNSINDTIKYRMEKDVTRNDFLQMLIEMKSNNVINIDELHAQCILFFLAGYETSATSMTFFLFELAVNQDIQDKLRNEINEVLTKYNGEITYDAVMNMNYLEMVTSEVLRLHSPFAILNRKCVKDFTLPDTNIVIEKGTNVVIPIIGLHNDPEYFPNPDKFDPERFSEKNKNNITPYTYMPFGEGPRNCLGDRFGKQQSKVGIISLLKNYRFKLNSQVKLPLEYDNSFFPNPKQTILLDVERVTQNNM